MTEGKMTKEELREDPVLEGLNKLKKFIDERGFFLLIVAASGDRGGGGIPGVPPDGRAGASRGPRFSSWTAKRSTSRGT